MPVLNIYNVCSLAACSHLSMHGHFRSILVFLVLSEIFVENFIIQREKCSEKKQTWTICQGPAAIINSVVLNSPET